MKPLSKQTTATLFPAFLGLILATFLIPARAEYDEICERFANGVQFREPGNCQAYVTCKNGIGTVTTCPSNQLYDKDSKKCSAKVTDAYCDPICSDPADNEKWVADPRSCNGFYYCRDGVAHHGVCYEGYNFNEDLQLCDFPTDYVCYGVPDFCKILPSSVQFAHPEACDKYFTCSKKSEQKMETCASDKYFDVSTAKCISKYNATCAAHPSPTNACGTNKSPTVDKPVSDGATCRGYFYCAYKGPNLADPNPKWYQCPEGTFFDAKAKACGDPTSISCSADRCDGRGNSLVLAANKYCQHYHVCQDGHSTGIQQCPRDMFFNEALQACVWEEMSYSICD